MDAKNGPDVIRREALIAAGPHDAGIVDHGVDPSKVLARGAHRSPRAVRVGDRVRVRDGFAALGRDLVHNSLRAVTREIATVGRRAEIVDDDACAFSGEQARVGPPQSGTAAGHEDYVASEVHAVIPLPVPLPFSRCDSSKYNPFNLGGAVEATTPPH